MTRDEYEGLLVTAAKPARKKTIATKADPNDVFAFQLKQSGWHGFERERLFAKEIGRRWKFDFALVIVNAIDPEEDDIQLAIEIEGDVIYPAMVFGKKRMLNMGRHSTPNGQEEDRIKYNAASLLGWDHLHFGVKSVNDGSAVAFVTQWLARRGVYPT